MRPIWGSKVLRFVLRFYGLAAQRWLATFFGNPI